MASEIRVNSLTNRSGLSTVSITDAGLNAVGIITAHNFKTGTTNVHSTGVTAADGVFTGNVSVTGNLNVSGVLTYDDVTNIDSVGVITARNAIVISEDNAIHFRGTAADDADAILRASAGGGQLLINSRNDAIINIDSNNDSTDAHFAIAHGAATGSSTELFRVQESGQVIIGDSASDLSGTHTFMACGSKHAFQFDGNTGTYLSFTLGSANGNVDIEADARSGGYPDLTFTTYNDERLRITAAGRMGLGTNDPAALLEVRDSENTTKGAAQIRISKGVGNGAAPTSVSRADSYLHIGGSEYHTSFGRYNIAFGYTNDEVGSGIPAYIGYVETSLSGYTQGDLVFGTRNSTTGTENPTERLRIGSGGGHKITCAEGYYAANLTECNDGRIALNINQTRQGQTKAIAIGAISGNTATGIQCYDTSNNSANNLLLNPFGGNVGIDNDAPPVKLAIKDTTNCKLLLSSSWSGTQEILFGGGSANSTGSGNSTAAKIIVQASAPGGAATGYMSFYTNLGDNISERLRITPEGHKWTNNGSIFHGSGDITDFTDSSRDYYNNVSLRSGRQNAGSSPTNDNSAIKIYPAGVRSTSTGNLTGGIAWQHLDPNNSNWGTSFGSGSQIWMGAALHDTPGQERDRFNLWMNDQTSAGSNPNNLAIEAYPNGIVRHPKVPSFLAKGGTALSNGSNVVIVGSGTEFNNGGHYSTSNGRFTAPIDGIYHFSFWGLLYPHNSGVMNIYYSRNGNQYGHLVQGGADSNTHTSRAGSIMMSMSAGDYADLRINRGNNTGVNAYGSQWNMCGFLVG